MTNRPTCTAFVGSRQLAAGPLDTVALAVKRLASRDPTAAALVFDDETGRVIDLDLRGSDADTVQRLERHVVYGSVELRPAAPRGPGRPKLGVVAREVTLLPRHWDWLNAQRGGASVALRRLVDEARQRTHGRDHVRRAQEAAYRFMSAMAGDLAGYEEATRALFAADRARFTAQTGGWPVDVRRFAAKLADAAFAAPEASR
ncbi:MAG: DUF2239 family protein [Alphaproteobacteria bacterium]|nr:DUF2239 family protein [Alphaproteobacteria bacterium]